MLKITAASQVVKIIEIPICVAGSFGKSFKGFAREVINILSNLFIGRWKCVASQMGHLIELGLHYFCLFFIGLQLSDYFWSFNPFGYVKFEDSQQTGIKETDDEFLLNKFKLYWLGTRRGIPMPKQQHRFFSRRPLLLWILLYLWGRNCLSSGKKLIECNSFFLWWICLTLVIFLKIGIYLIGMSRYSRNYCVWSSH